MAFLVTLLVLAAVLWLLRRLGASSNRELGTQAPHRLPEHTHDSLPHHRTGTPSSTQASTSRSEASEARFRPAPTAVAAPLPTTPAAATRDRESATSGAGRTRWVPQGEAVEVAGYVLRDGMVYVGHTLPAAASWAGMEPALIDPRLRVETSPTAIRDSSAGYWPSYSQVSPGFRAKYLRWLAGGRSDPEVDTGCVFLFFYGIERRLLLDTKRGVVAEDEAQALIAEVERLLGIYGGNSSFRGYASSFLYLLRVRHGAVDLEASTPPAESSGYELPLTLRARLGRFALDRAPIPAEWALAWVRLSPLVSLRTPATRCPGEFEAAFRHAYRARFGEGMVLKANKTELSLTYQPASASFGGNPVRLPIPGIPDVGVLTAPVDRLRQVAEAASDSIDKYSRWVGRTGEGESLPALALLPTPVLRRRVRRSPPPLVAEIAAAVRPDGPATIPSSFLLRHWPGAKGDRLSRKEAEGLIGFLEKLGLGIAPDVRHTGINLSQSEKAAVFLLPGEAAEPGPDFAAATLLLTLSAAVAGADALAVEEEEQIERHLEAAYRLADADRARLRAHLAWLRACPPSLAGLKKQLEPLAAEQRARIARALIAVAGADGHVSPAEVKVLAKLYPLLGLDAARLYADVHALAAGPGPVTVIAAEPEVEHAIPRPAAASASPSPPSGFSLDLSRIRAITDETHDVTRVLASVFAGEEPADTAAASASPPAAPMPDGGVATEGEEAPAAADERLPGLDAAHSAVVRALGERSDISAAEFATLADAHGLMAGGAMETINDAAFQLCDEPLLEGDDPIEINPHAREELFR